jgi:very-short-patch-repair endonuclease
MEAQNSKQKDELNSPPQEEGCPKGGVVDIIPHNTEITQASKIKRNSKNYFSLPYNPALKDRAKALRQAGNLSEVLFWNEVKRKKFKGLDFDRQKIVGNYIVDFYCPNYQVVVEVDGSSHDNKQEYDAQRDEYLNSLGLTVIHIKVQDIKHNLRQTMNWLLVHPAFEDAE